MEACLRGDQSAWSAIVEKYRNLVYSVPAKYHLSPEDSADLFQAVWVDLTLGLSALRSPTALPAWLITAATRRCYHHIKRLQRRKIQQGGEELSAVAVDAGSLNFVEELEREQMVRDAMGQIPERCRRMMKMLFYEHPPLPYRQVASRLGLAEGSIGFIRGRCLQRLRQALEGMGF